MAPQDPYRGGKEGRYGLISLRLFQNAIFGFFLMIMPIRMITWTVED